MYVESSHRDLLTKYLFDGGGGGGIFLENAYLFEVRGFLPGLLESNMYLRTR